MDKWSGFRVRAGNTQGKSTIFCRIRKERAKNKQDGEAAKEEEANFGR